MPPTLVAALAALGQVNKAFTRDLGFQFSNLPRHGYYLGVPSYFLTFSSFQAIITLRFFVPLLVTGSNADQNLQRKHFEFH
jgi:hypothetical protein